MTENINKTINKVVKKVATIAEKPDYSPILDVKPVKNELGNIIYEKGTSALFVLNSFKSYLKTEKKEALAVLDSRYERKEVSFRLKRIVLDLSKTNPKPEETPEEKAIRSSSNNIGRVDRILSDIAYKLRLGLKIA